MKKPKKPQNPKAVVKRNADNSDDKTGLEDIRDVLERRLEDVIPKKSKGQVLDMVLEVVSEEYYSGPIPHPKHLGAYEQIHPGLADRIVGMAERTLDANLAIPDKIIEAESSYRTKGLIFGFLTLIILVGAATYCGVNGHPKLAAGLIGVGLIGTIGKFIDGKRQPNQSEEDKK